MKRKKNYSIKKLSAKIRAHQRQGKKVVFTNGCFDILHCGHTAYLDRAKSIGDILVVAVNADSSVRAIKGKKRPIRPLRDRLELLSHLDCIDYLCSFSQTTPLATITTLKPDILVKGADWKVADIVGADIVKKNGGTVKTIPFKKGYSTSKIIAKIRSSL